MASIKDMLSKGVASVNVKTSNFMEVNKIRTYINNLSEEINTLEKTIGAKSYEMWKNGNFDLATVEQEMMKIKANQEEIANQESKIKELEEEANKILGGAVEADLSGKVVCPSCGRTNNADSKFCVGCGTSLK